MQEEERRLSENSGNLLYASLSSCSMPADVLMLRPAKCRHTLLDISPLLQDAGAAIVDDSFLRCFQVATWLQLALLSAQLTSLSTLATLQGVSTEPWNWNAYLFPIWSLGLIVRYLILFPLRWVYVCLL